LKELVERKIKTPVKERKKVAAKTYLHDVAESKVVFIKTLAETPFQISTRSGVRNGLIEPTGGLLPRPWFAIEPLILFYLVIQIVR